MDTGVLNIYILLTKGNDCLAVTAGITSMTVRYIYSFSMQLFLAGKFELCLFLSSLLTLLVTNHPGTKLQVTPAVK